MEPTRFELSPKDLASGFASIGHKGELPMFGKFPRASKRLSKNVSSNGKTLTPEARALFEVLATPSQSINLRAFQPDLPRGLETQIIRGGADDMFGLIATSPDEIWDIALVPKLNMILVILDEIMEITLHHVSTPSIVTSLSVSALTVLAAISDLLRLESIASIRARAPVRMDVATKPLAQDTLREMISQGMESNDMRWSVSLVAAITDGLVQRTLSGETISDGLQALHGEGLVDEDTILTSKGAELASVIRGLLTASSMEVVTKAVDGSFTLDRLVGIRSSRRFLLGAWESPETDAPLLRLTDLGTNKTFSYLHDVLSAKPEGLSEEDKPVGQIQKKEVTDPEFRSPWHTQQQTATSETEKEQVPDSDQQAKLRNIWKPAPKYCVSCGSALKPRAKFCTKCGAQQGQNT